LASNFNILYSNTLTEDEKKELSELLSIPETELNANFGKLQEEVTEKINKMITEEKQNEVKNRLASAVSEAGSMKPSKFNYYKLQQLKKGL
jgi:hypothetical protein